MVIILMGVAGAGKTTIGRALAAALGWEFVEGDDFHTAANREKMRQGIALSDSDRSPWLNRIRELILDRLAGGIDAVVACSALKRRYRALLAVDPVRVRFIHLTAGREVLQERIRSRHGHFMPADLLDSQLATLEPPPGAMTIDVSASPDCVVAAIREQLAI